MRISEKLKDGFKKNVYSGYSMMVCCFCNTIIATRGFIIKTTTKLNAINGKSTTNRLVYII